MKCKITGLSILLILGAIFLGGCGAGEYQVGGAVTGLDQTTERVGMDLNDGQETLAVPTGKFKFDTKLKVGLQYKVSVTSVPPAARCSIRNFEGVISSASPSSVQVNCAWLGQQSIEFSENVTVDSGVVDQTGEIYISGRKGNATYIQKLDTDGSVIWTKMYDPSIVFIISDIVADSDGGIYCVGTATTAFGDMAPSLGNRDIIAMHLNSSGDMQWVRTLGGAGENSGAGVHLHGGILYVSGKSWGGGQYEGLPLPSSQIADIVVSALQANTGADVWNKIIHSGVNESTGGGLTTDKNENVILTGYVSGGNTIYRLSSQDGTIMNQKRLSNGSAIGKIQLTSDGNIVLAGTVQDSFLSFKRFAEGDAFVMEVDNDFNLVWADLLGVNEDAAGFQLVSITSGVWLDAEGNILVSGTLSSGAFRDQVNRGGTDAFVAQWSPTGQRQLVRQFGTSGSDLPVYSAVLPNSDILVGGATDGDMAGNGASISGRHQFMAVFRPVTNGIVCAGQDTDQDGICDDLDSDDDNDGFPDSVDACPLVAGDTNGCPS